MSNGTQDDKREVDVTTCKRSVTPVLPQRSLTHGRSSKAAGISNLRLTQMIGYQWYLKLWNSLSILTYAIHLGVSMHPQTD